MTPERYQQVARLYHAALELTPAERAAFLSTACAEDEELRREVETLLAADEETGGCLQVPVRQFAAELLAEKEETLRRLVSAGPTFSPGQVLSGRYEIVRFVAQGGMGEVYEAEDRELRERVALKTVRPEIAGDARAMSRFRREIQLARKVTHPNVCRIYDLSRHHSTGADDRTGEITFLTMELLRGVTLAEALRQQGRLTTEAALPLVSQMAAALSAAHQAGVIHRDFKSNNVMLVEPKSDTQAIRAVITDFGLARSSARDESFAQSVSTTGEIVGTPAYMAPEQVEGQPATAAADIYALGVVLYEMITGHLPFVSDTPFATALKRLREVPSSPRVHVPDLDPNWEAAILRCLARDPADRFARVEDVVKAIRGEEVSSAAAPATVASQPRVQIPPASRSRWRLHPMIWAGAVLIIVGVAFLFWQFNLGRRRAATSLPNPTFTQLTEQLGEELSPSFAPDGKSFVYASRAAGNWDIYLQRVGGKNPINLTKDSAAHETQPSISPDGERIVFRSERDGGGLYVMGATGENTKRVTDFGFNPSWSPDGQFIACDEQSVTSAHARGVIPCLSWIVNVRTGEKRRLSDRDALQPQWSPKGGRIAYWGVSEGTRPRDIWTIPAEGGEPVAVTNDPAVDWNPVWSPDGRYLYFASDRSGSMNLWRVPIDEASGRVLGPLEPVTTPSVNSAQLSFARDGRLLYVRQETQKNLQRIAFDPVREKIVGDPIWITSSARQATFPALSPDGEWLAFCSIGDRQEDIFIARRDGSAVRNLTDDAPKDRSPRWSPDSRRLAFFSDRGGRWEVWLINADGTGLRQLTHTSGNPVVNPLWSPDGARLAFSLNGGTAFIVEVDKPWEAQTPLQIPPAPLPGIKFIAWGWSADGKKLAGFHRGIEEFDSGIGVYSFTTGRVEPLVEFGGFPLWLRDSRRLLFVAGGRLLLLDTNTKQPRELFSVAPHRIEGFTLSRDDRQIYFSRASNEADIWLMSVE